jgi:undecaprenyl diphosphate synthase
MDLETLPAHVGIIMDGNGRWAKQRNKPRLFGHRAGVETIRNVVTLASSWGLDVLTLYAFSTENWKRPKAEVQGLMKLFGDYLKKEVDALHKNKVCLRIIGRRDVLAPALVKLIEEAEALTRDNEGLVLNVAVNYGGRLEVLDAVRGLAQKVKDGSLDPMDIDEPLFSRELYTAELPDPDLIIRTSGEHRLSNFLIWQCAYSELWFTPVLWPDFSEAVFREALEDYARRKRRFGGIG